MKARELIKALAEMDPEIEIIHACGSKTLPINKIHLAYFREVKKTGCVSSYEISGAEGGSVAAYIY